MALESLTEDVGFESLHGFFEAETTLPPFLPERLGLTGSPDRNGKIVLSNQVPVAEREPMFDRVLELADIAWPAIAVE